MIFDYLNRLVLKQIAKRNRKVNLGMAPGTVAATELGLVITSADSEAYTLVWKDITRIAALKVPNFVGDMLMLAFEVQGEHSFTLTENTMGWSEVCQNLPIHLHGALPYED